MADVQDIIEYCDKQLQPQLFKDYCPNGLQVSGKKTVTSIASAVTADLATINKAISQNVDLLLVHHGLFWSGQSQVITGLLRERLAACLSGDLNLIAYHLPLDAHHELGNNCHIADQLGIKNRQDFPYGSPPIGGIGQLATPMSPTKFCHFLTEIFGNKVVHLPGEYATIEKVAWCSGAAQSGLLLAAAQGAHAYLSGEVSERTFYEAKESGVHYFGAGHHVTEVGGVQRLGAQLAKIFSISHHFIDSRNPC